MLDIKKDSLFKPMSQTHTLTPNSIPFPFPFPENMSIVAESPGFIQVFSDGSVKRFSPEIAPASTEIYNGYKCKDIILDPLKPLKARIFFPNISSEEQCLLPVLVYFHGGGFSIGSTAWLGYHHFLGDLSVVSKSIVLSIDYRLAPENKLPIAYEDCYFSLLWLTEEMGSETWLERADLSRVFLSGDSAGGNIAHHVAVKALRKKPGHVTIKGILPIHPYFGSEKRTELEMSEGSFEEVKSNDMFWRLSIPEGLNRDYYGCNFEKIEMSAEEWDNFPKVVVYVAGLDFLKERGVMYAEFLEKKGVKVSIIEAEGESHVYHVYHPDREVTRILQKQMSDFIHSL